MYWKEKDRLLHASRADLPELVQEIVAKHQATRQDDWKNYPTPISKSGGRLLVCAVSDLPASLPLTVPSPCLKSDEPDVGKLAYVVISDDLSSFSVPEERKDVLLVEMSEGKKGQTQFLHAVLPQSIPFIQTQLDAGTSVCVACHNGKDAGVGVVLATLQTLFDEEGNYDGRSSSGT